MTSVNLTVLDIGHGNCTLVKSETSMTVIDAAQANDLLDILTIQKVNLVHDLIISHADSDHIGGAISLLMSEDIAVERVHVNTDPIKDTQKWKDLAIAIYQARKQQGTKLVVGITRDSDDILYDDYKLEVLAPNPVSCLTGPGTNGLVDDAKLNANSLSVVLKLVHQDESIALIPGDMDGNTLKYLKEEEQCLRSKVLIFPHHGGLPGSGEPQAFAKELSALCNPDLILFSNSRNKHNNPIPEIIAGIKQSECGAYLACTQLSKACCDDEAKLSDKHLGVCFPSKGAKKNHSCAGSVSIILNGKDTDVRSHLNDHESYIANFPDRKCV